MRYRKLDADGDYVFGAGPQQMLVNSPEAVAQAILTRLRLATGEWFLDLDEGTPYKEQILGVGKQTTIDIAIKQRILETQGVVELSEYSSYADPYTRAATVAKAVVVTQYGNTTITV